MNNQIRALAELNAAKDRRAGPRSENPAVVGMLLGFQRSISGRAERARLNEPTSDSPGPPPVKGSELGQLTLSAPRQRPRSQPPSKATRRRQGITIRATVGGCRSDSWSDANGRGRQWQRQFRHISHSVPQGRPGSRHGHKIDCRRKSRTYPLVRQHVLAKRGRRPEQARHRLDAGGGSMSQPTAAPGFTATPRVPANRADSPPRESTKLQPARPPFRLPTTPGPCTRYPVPSTGIRLW